jgi:hypothetical protein
MPIYGVPIKEEALYCAGDSEMQITGLLPSKSHNIKEDKMK